jgi:hypothetical protein
MTEFSTIYLFFKDDDGVLSNFCSRGIRRCVAAFSRAAQAAGV